jgi:hypothetical protein
LSTDSANPAGPYRLTTTDTPNPVTSDAELVVDSPWQEQSGQLPGGGNGHNGKNFEGRSIGSWNRFGNNNK